VTTSVDIAGSSSNPADEDPGWCPQRKRDRLCARDWGHWGAHDFSRKADAGEEAQCGFTRTETVVAKLGTRQHTQQWAFSCTLKEGHRHGHQFSPIPDGHAHAVDVPRSHWKRQRRLMN
jgi:hypothetical protein